jgi:hypothetical protein
MVEDRRLLSDWQSASRPTCTAARVAPLARQWHSLRGEFSVVDHDDRKKKSVAV